VPQRAQVVHVVDLGERRDFSEWRDIPDVGERRDVGDRLSERGRLGAERDRKAG
jgi:hypothetical protein